jgi:hypothetical protein
MDDSIAESTVGGGVVMSAKLSDAHAGLEIL